jgi:hypothetical protein
MTREVIRLSRCRLVIENYQGRVTGKSRNSDSQNQLLVPTSDAPA